MQTKQSNMTYQDLIDKIHQIGCYDDPVKFMSMHTNEVFKITTWHEAKVNEPYESIEKGQVIFDIELNNY
jgi:hypothetical protein